MIAGRDSELSQLSTSVEAGTKQKVKGQLGKLLNICPQWLRLVSEL